MAEKTPAPKKSIVDREQALREYDLSEAWVCAFDGRCRVIELTPERIDEVETFIAEYRKTHGQDLLRKHIFAIWIANCMVDGERKRIFSDEDIPAIAVRRPRDVRRLFKAISDLNGLSMPDEDDDEGN